MSDDTALFIVLFALVVVWVWLFIKITMVERKSKRKCECLCLSCDHNYYRIDIEVSECARGYWTGDAPSNMYCCSDYFSKREAEA